MGIFSGVGVGVVCDLVGGGPSMIQGEGLGVASGGKESAYRDTYHITVILGTNIIFKLKHNVNNSLLRALY